LPVPVCKPSLAVDLELLRAPEGVAFTVAAAFDESRKSDPLTANVAVAAQILAGSPGGHLELAVALRASAPCE
jgi:hypothetical protein